MDQASHPPLAHRIRTSGVLDMPHGDWEGNAHEDRRSLSIYSRRRKVESEMRARLAAARAVPRQVVRLLQNPVVSDMQRDGDPGLGQRDVIA